MKQLQEILRYFPKLVKTVLMQITSRPEAEFKKLEIRIIFMVFGKITFSDHFLLSYVQGRI